LSWAKAGLCWLAAAILGAIYLAGGLAGRTAEDAQVPGLRPDDVAGPVETPPPSDLPEPVQAIEIRRGEDVVAWERDGERWRVTAPAGKSVPGGLLGAFVEQLDALRFAERFEGDAADPAFGLHEPGLRIAVVGADGERVMLVVGARTPTGTAAYGRREDGGPVVLVGLNLLYYADLLFDAAR
jgi:hypothetical protein